MSIRLADHTVSDEAERESMEADRDPQNTGGRITLRALIVGGGMGVAIAAMAPIGSLIFGTRDLFGNYLPPIAVVIAAALGLANPLLGRRRFARGELITILVMVLCLGGVVGQGLMRQLPGVLVGPAATLPNLPGSERLLAETDGDDEERLEALAADILAAFDHDGDGIIAGAERVAMGPCLGPARQFQAADLVAALRRPDEGYAFPTALVVGVEERGAVDPHAGRAQHLVGGYQNGLKEDGEPRVGYGDTVQVAGAGQGLRWLVASGVDRDRALRAGRGVADPTDHPVAYRSLLHARVGAEVPFAGATLEVEAIAPATIPWRTWWRSLAAWSPLLIGMMAAMIAVAGIVRHQWLVGERLAFPIARVLSDLTAERGTGCWRSRGLWIAAAIVVVIHTWRGAHNLGWMPIDFPLALNFGSVLPWDGWMGELPHRWALTNPKLSFTVLAMTFLITPEVGRSLWLSFVGGNVICALLVVQGFPVGRQDLETVSTGGAGVLALVVLWIGRHYYLAVLRAACGRGGDAAARAAAPYLALLLAGCGVMLAFMLAAGVGIGAGVVVILLILLLTLAFARVVAESGVPFAGLGNEGRLGGMTMLWLAPGVPSAALLPLAMIGAMLGPGDRERMMTHALTAHAMDERAGSGLGIGRISILAAVSGAIGIVAAFVALLIAAYHGGGAVAGDPWPSWIWSQASGQVATILDGAPGVADRQGRAINGYVVGAILVGVMSLGRLRFQHWPLHPVGLLLMGSWITTVAWGSYFLGWLIKSMVLRYGGQALYQHLVPVAIGLVLGDAVAVVAGVALHSGAYLLGFGG